MWIHMHIIRRAIARRPLLWIARCLCMILLALLSISTWWIGSSRIADLERQASLLTVDVILMPDVDLDAGSIPAHDCRASVRRRPDVVSAKLLSRHTVWRLFQYELGIQSGGLTDLATMPSVIQVRLRPTFATLKNAYSVRDYLLRNHRDVIDRVLIPEAAYIEIGSMAAQVRTNRTWGMVITLALVLIGLVVMTISVRKEVLPVPLHTVLGKSPSWGVAYVIGCVGLLAVIACILALALVVTISPHLQTHVPWLCNASVMFEV